MGVNRQQALQGGLASHQLVNVREQEDGNITRELTSSQAVETQQHNEKEKKKDNMAAHGIEKVILSRVKQYKHNKEHANSTFTDWKIEDTHKTRRSAFKYPALLTFI